MCTSGGWVWHSLSLFNHSSDINAAISWSLHNVNVCQSHYVPQNTLLVIPLYSNTWLRVCRFGKGPSSDCLGSMCAGQGRVFATLSRNLFLTSYSWPETRRNCYAKTRTLPENCFQFATCSIINVSQNIRWNSNFGKIELTRVVIASNKLERYPGVRTIIPSFFNQVGLINKTFVTFYNPPSWNQA